MQAAVYVETSVISYLVGRISRDLIVAGHQQITREWWETASVRYRLMVSEAVMEEIAAGDPEMARQRLNAVGQLEVLTMSDEVADLAKFYAESLGLPASAKADLVHIAFSVAVEADYLVTWNCRHIANGATIRRLQELNARADRPTPVIVTPEALLE